MEDAPAKPDPTPVLMACELIGMSPNDCFMIGDTPDDVRSAILAGVVPWGVLTPEEDARITLGLSTLSAGMGPSLQAAGAVCVMRAGLGTILDLIKKDIAEPVRFLTECVHISPMRRVCFSFSLSFFFNGCLFLTYLFTHSLTYFLAYLLVKHFSK